jgi:uncharacterized protein YcbK (DUF882 family)
MCKTEQQVQILETDMGLNRKSASMRRFSRSVAFALPVGVSLFLGSCTSTGSGLDVSGAGLQAGLTAPLPSNPQQIDQAGSAATSIIPQVNQVATPAFTTTQQSQPTPGAVQTTAAPQQKQLDQNSKILESATTAVASKTTQASESVVQKQAALEKPSTDVEAQSKPANETASEANTVAEKPGAVVTNNGPVVQNLSEAKTISDNGDALTQTPAVSAAPPPVKKKTLFDSLFASNKNGPSAQQAEGDAETTPTQLALATPPPPPKKAKTTVEPVLQPLKPETQSDDPAGDNGELPGVRKGALFEIKRRDSLYSDEDVDIGETDSGPVLLASAGGLARLAPNGLKVQRESVDVACIKPQLVKMIKSIETHYNSTVVVTSGYRSPGYNRRVRGAKNSLHMFCAAVDIQVVGVGKWELAKYARSMPGRGGVGTYCHTDSIHIDVGPDRDWNWRCSRRK